MVVALIDYRLETHCKRNVFGLVQESVNRLSQLIGFGNSAKEDQPPGS